MNIVVVKNTSGKQFTDKWDGTKFTIAPGKQLLVPFEAACRWFGNPHATNSERNQTRLKEHQRLRVKYGVYEKDELWDINVPKLEVYTPEGERLYTVVDDPEGEHITAASTTVTEAHSTTEMIAAMQRQIKALERLVAQQNAAENIDGKDVADDDDDDYDSVDGFDGSLTDDGEPVADDGGPVEEDSPNRLGAR